MVATVFDWYNEERTRSSSVIRGLDRVPGGQAQTEVPSQQHQVPTPPGSSDGSAVFHNVSQEQNERDINVSVSTTFHPNAGITGSPPDLVLVSTDSIFFYVNSRRIVGASDNGFGGLISMNRSNEDSSMPTTNVSEPSDVLNVLLHTIHELSCTHYSPSIQTLFVSVDRMAVYGINPRQTIIPSKPLFNHLLSHAPLFPIDIYSLAAAHRLEDLAVSSSSHLLSFPLFTLTDDMSKQIGSVYLKRLFFLHLGRIDALKRVLLTPPHPHAPTPSCDFADQKDLARAWALAAASLVWEARPDLSTGLIDSSLRPLGEHLSCELCKLTLEERIKTLVIEWASVKRTI